MKKQRTLCFLFALALGSALWAQTNGGLSNEAKLKAQLENYDKLSLEYKKFEEDARAKHKDNLGRYLLDIYDYSIEKPVLLPPYTDFVKWGIATKSPDIVKMAMSAYNAGEKAATFVGDTEIGKIDKADFYRLSSEIQLYVLKNEKKAQEEADRCAGFDKAIGSEAYYNLAEHYIKAKAVDNAFIFYKKAFDIDKDLEKASIYNIADYSDLCAKKKLSSDLEKLWDRYVSSEKKRADGILAFLIVTGYEKAKRPDKAALSALMNNEDQMVRDESKVLASIAVLRKHYGKNKAASACIDFLNKFYDKNASLGEEDLASLPKDTQDFLFVRYMYDMKNSNDIAALRKSYEGFFGSQKYFYARLAQKAEAQGDKAALAEFQKKMNEIKDYD